MTNSDLVTPETTWSVELDRSTGQPWQKSWLRLSYSDGNYTLMIGPKVGSRECHVPVTRDEAIRFATRLVNNQFTSVADNRRQLTIEYWQGSSESRPGSGGTFVARAGRRRKDLFVPILMVAGFGRKILAKVSTSSLAS
jgi:hypothetical protein